jgi:hypothetical protein
VGETILAVIPRVTSGTSAPTTRGPPPNKALQLTWHSTFQLTLVAFWHRTWVPQRPSAACATQLSALSVRPQVGMNIEIKHLCGCPEHLGTVARWIHEEWWSDKPGHTVETMASRLGEASDQNAAPLSLVAPHAGNPVGTVNLVANDNEEHPDLAPWLAALLRGWPPCL